MSAPTETSAERPPGLDALNARLARLERDLMRVETSRGAEQTISTAKYEVTGRGGKGRELLQRGQFSRMIPSDLLTPPPLETS